MINEKKIQYFLTICEEQSFSAAAKKLYVTQPVLSRMILEIEEEMGQPLFFRTSHGLQLTPAGQIYQEGCLRLMTEEKRTRQKLEDLKEGIRGGITLGCSTQTGGYALPRLLETFRRDYPGISLSVVEAPVQYLEEMTAEGKVDLAITNYCRRADLTYTYLRNDEIYVMAPPDYCKVRPELEPGTDNPSISINELENQPLILLKPGRGLRTSVNELLRKYEITPKILLETESIYLAYSLVLENLGFTFISDVSLRYFDKYHIGTYLPITKEKTGRPVYVCCQKYEKLTKPMELMQKLLGEIFS